MGIGCRCEKGAEDSSDHVIKKKKSTYLLSFPDLEQIALLKQKCHKYPAMTPTTKYSRQLLARVLVQVPDKYPSKSRPDHYTRQLLARVLAAMG